MSDSMNKCTKEKRLLFSLLTCCSAETSREGSVAGSRDFWSVDASVKVLETGATCAHLREEQTQVNQQDST